MIRYPQSNVGNDTLNALWHATPVRSVDFVESLAKLKQSDSWQDYQIITPRFFSKWKKMMAAMLFNF